MPGSGNQPASPEQELEPLATQLKSFIHAAIDPGEPIFNSPCNPSLIEEMETTMKITLPSDYKALVQLGNGSRDPLFLTFPPDQLSFLPAEEVLSLWMSFMDDLDDDNDFYDELTFDDKVREVLIHPGRIPIAQNELGGQYLCIDYIPGPKGILGQLVFNINEADCVVLADSVTTLIRNYVAALEAGALAVERVPEDYGGSYWFTANGRNVDYDAYRSLDA